MGFEHVEQPEPEAVEQMAAPQTAELTGQPADVLELDLESAEHEDAVEQPDAFADQAPQLTDAEQLDLADALQEGQNLADSGVAYEGDVPESELGELTPPGTSESRDLALADVGDLGADLAGQGVRLEGSVSESELGSLTPPPTPEQ